MLRGVIMGVAGCGKSSVASARTFPIAIGAEPLDIDLTRSVDRDFDDVAIVEERFQRSERPIEKVVPIVGGKLS